LAGKTKKRRQVEIDFYEQIWIILNPENNEVLKTSILSEFLKILFSPISSCLKEISVVLRQFLQTAFFLNSNIPENEKKYISPINQKELGEEEIWTLEKLVKEFLNLKQNSLAYQNICNVKNPTNNKNDNMTFSPKINNYSGKVIPPFEERLYSSIEKN